MPADWQHAIPGFFFVVLDSFLLPACGFTVATPLVLILGKRAHANAAAR